jgi:hypothetical protein
MRTSLLVLFAVCLAFVSACNGGTSSTADSGGTADTGGGDSGSTVDSGSSVDSGSRVDSGSGTDSGATADAASEVDGGATDAGSATDSGRVDVDAAAICPPMGTGASCAGPTDCPGGFVCDLGRCIPQGRPTCGGFAGAACRDPLYTQCLYETGHGDVGTCFTTGEVACLCSVAAAQWSCP